MAFSGGTYSLVAGNPVVTGTTISSTTHNNTLTDIASNGLTICVLKDGSQTITANIPMAGFIFTGLGAGSAAGHSIRYQQLFTTSAVTMLGAMDWVTGAAIASAATVNLTTATGNAVHITGTTTITTVTLGTGMWRLVIFDGALTLTHNTTTNNLPGAANITTVANDRALYWADGTTVYCMAYVPATVTGTGSTVLHNTPTFVAPVLGAATGTSVTLTGASSAATVAGAQVSSQANMETATATDLLVPPGRQHFHPGMPKGWARITNPTTVVASYPAAGVSVVNNSTGVYTVTHGLTFSGATAYVGLVSVHDTGASVAASALIDTYGTTTMIVRTYNQAGTVTDMPFAYVLFGDL